MQINKEAECEIIKRQMSKTQQDWIQYFNNKGEKMISTPDIYRVAKEEKKGLIESLQKDFKDKWIVTSTRIVYNKDNLDAKIIHDIGSTIVKSKKYNLEVPVYDGELVKENSETEAYLQTLFDTKDNLAEILKVMKRFGEDRKLYLWTPSQSSRASKQVRSVVLYWFDLFGRFDVVGVNWFGDDCGFSRGVVVESAKQTKKSRGTK